LDVAGNINFSGTLSYQGAPLLQVPGGGSLGNIAVGLSTLSRNIGARNTATGVGALYGNTTGSYNTAMGYAALGDIGTGNNNIAVGYQAGQNVAAGSNNIYIGSPGVLGDEGDTIRIGTPGTQTFFYVAGIYGENSSGIPVYFNYLGRLGTVSSSRRYKEDIQDMGDASGFDAAPPSHVPLQKPFEDGSKPIQYGLIAEEVAEVYPDLVARSADGQIETVKYQLLDSMLLNEAQKQQKEIATLKDQDESLRTV
jgi:hypothetical protein